MEGGGGGGEAFSGDMLPAALGNALPKTVQTVIDGIIGVVTRAAVSPESGISAVISHTSAASGQDKVNVIPAQSGGGKHPVKRPPKFLKLMVLVVNEKRLDIKNFHLFGSTRQTAR